MASAPSDRPPVLGRLDGKGRLIAADSELEALQKEAGSSLGQMLALPQVAAVAHLARKLGIPVARPAIAAASDHDLELWVRASPEGDEVALAIEGWTRRAPAAPRLASLLGGTSQAESSQPRHEWAADEELRVISLSEDLAEYLAIELSETAGQPLTRIVRLEEDEAGEMPLISALASRRAFTGQRARSRTDDSRSILLNGEVVAGADGSFAGFQGTAEVGETVKAVSEPERTAAFDLALDEALRSPLDRIIESAERIVERSDGPLRSDYANYGNDIAAAARHLLSVIRSMSEHPAQEQATIDLTAVAAEAVVMLDATAEEREVTITLEVQNPLPARGEERAVIQILVNLIVNAIRHSPEKGTVTLNFGQTEGTASVTVSDKGPGIDPADQQRIFERFERAGKEGGTGLGLAISRRLARSMGGDVTLECAPEAGAHFTLTLPTP